MRDEGGPGRLGMARAAVLTGLDQPLAIRDDVVVEAPKAGEIRIRVAACGVCRSDLSMQDGTMPIPMPAVLGHEASAVVEEVGEGVTDLAPGDHVVVSWVPQCGGCFFCRRGQAHLCQAADVSSPAVCSTAPPGYASTARRSSRCPAPAPSPARR